MAYLNPCAKAIVRIIAMTLMAVAVMARRMINLEKECSLLNAIRRAMKLGRFNQEILTLKNRLPAAVRKVFSRIELTLHYQMHMKYLFILGLISLGTRTEAQKPDSVYMPNI
jgi:hypothetical protein